MLLMTFEKDETMEHNLEFSTEIKSGNMKEQQMDLVKGIQSLLTRDFAKFPARDARKKVQLALP